MRGVTGGRHPFDATWRWSEALSSFQSGRTIAEVDGHDTPAIVYPGDVERFDVQERVLFCPCDFHLEYRE
nr:hypothetical protein [Providencia stuartii]